MKIIRLLLLLFFIQLSVFLKAQSIARDTVLTDTMSTKYYPATSEPNVAWKSIDFDDSQWGDVQGIHSFSYGYDNIPNFTVETPKVQSVYIRSFFNIDTIDNYKELVLQCDFDDAFVAYINGVEFARVNLGKYNSPTTYNQLSDRSHELEIYSEVNYPVMGYYIDSTFIKNNLIVGQNVLAIEVHNDSIDGTDLGLYHVLLNFTKVNYDIFRFDHQYKKCVEIDSTSLPIIVIETDEFGIPYNQIKGDWIDVPATLGIINNGAGNYNKPEDEYTDYTGNIKIRYRGESSASFAKRPYNIELKDEQGKDTSVSLLGLPSDGDWVLQGPYADKSQLRNALIYELGNKTGNWTPHVKFCEVILNGQNVGLYNLIEKIERDSVRINVGKLTETEISGTDLTGGYILKYDKPSSQLAIVYPKEKNLQVEQEDYIKGFIKEYEAVLKTNDGLDPVLGYKKYIDEKTLIDYVIIAELGKNCDSYLYSTYLHKDKNDRDGRVKFGPLWDFDLCFGNSVWQDGGLTEGWQYEYPGNSRFNVKRLFQDTELVDAFQARWFELREQFLHTDSLFARIDELTTELEVPLKRNYEVWPLVDEGIFFPEYYVYSYEEEIEYMKNWITARVNWMDANINDIFYEVKDYTSVEDNLADEANQFSANVYPNPFSKEFYIDLNLPVAGNLQIEIINIQGKVVSVIENTHVDKGNYKVYWNKGSENLAPGLHLVSIRIDGKLYDHIKVISLGN